MKRAIIVPAVLSGAPLDELKQWLAITTNREDDALIGLLRAATETCEAFTGRMPLEAVCEEVLPAAGHWQRIAAGPVQSVTAMYGIPADGARFTVAPDDYEADLDADGTGLVRLLRQGAAGRIAVQFTAGVAPDWASLPDGLKHGILRLAAHHFRQRDRDPVDISPPTAVAALWHPWRRLRLA